MDQEASASVAGTTATTSKEKTSKRKKKVLTIQEKVAIVKELDEKAVSATILSERYGVGKSTISGIKKNREAILSFQQKMTDMGMSKKAKIMKLGDDMKHDEAVYIWFKQKRGEGTPINNNTCTYAIIIFVKCLEMHIHVAQKKSCRG